MVTIIGAGLAGCEAAFQLAQRGIDVTLIEQKPIARTPAQTSDKLCELVCSNSMRSVALGNAVGLLKEELRRAGSLILACADEARVPAGLALAVDRDVFADKVTRAIEKHPKIRVEHRVVETIPEEAPVILATGPLTGEKLTEDLARTIGGEHLAYYDAIAPIVSADSLDWDKVFRQSRYDKGGDDYVNAPLHEGQYLAFVKAVLEANKVEARAFEDVKYFEGCLPIEVMAQRGEKTLAYGPMKPVGLDTDAHAVVQLRAENKYATCYNLVGFQTRLTYGEQKRVFAMIPALRNAEFIRFGSIHRNSYLETWRLCGPELELHALPHVRLAGQITGVEGYIESTAMGLLAALFTHGRLVGRPVPAPPPTTAFGALYQHLMRRRAPGEPFAPTNINFGLLPPLDGRPKKRERRALHAERATAALGSWLQAVA